MGVLKEAKQQQKSRPNNNLSVSHQETGLEKHLLNQTEGFFIESLKQQALSAMASMGQKGQLVV